MLQPPTARRAPAARVHHGDRFDDPYTWMADRESPELLELLAQGRDNAQIAATLGLSEKTVRNRLTSVFAKLDVDSRGRAIVLARDSGFGKLTA